MVKGGSGELWGATNWVPAPHDRRLNIGGKGFISYNIYIYIYIYTHRYFLLVYINTYIWFAYILLYDFMWFLRIDVLFRQGFAGCPMDAAVSWQRIGSDTAGPLDLRSLSKQLTMGTWQDLTLYGKLKQTWLLFLIWNYTHIWFNPQNNNIYIGITLGNMKNQNNWQDPMISRIQPWVDNLWGWARLMRHNWMPRFRGRRGMNPTWWGRRWRWKWWIIAMSSRESPLMFSMMEWGTPHFETASQ